MREDGLNGLALLHSRRETDIDLNRMTERSSKVKKKNIKSISTNEVLYKNKRLHDKNMSMKCQMFFF